MYRSSVRELHRSFKPLLYIVRISGLLPNEIREVNGDLITGRSTFGFTQTVIFIILYSGMVYFMRKNDIVVMELDGISKVMENIQLLAFELSFYIVVLSGIIRQKEFLRIIKRISELDSLLFQLREEIDYQKEFKRNLIFVGLFCTMFGSIGIAQLLQSFQPGFKYYFYILMWFTPSFFMHLTVLQFAVMLLSLKLRCSKLNNAVSTMINFADEQNLNVGPNIEIEDENSRNMIYCSYNIAGTIWNLSVVYDVICDICKTINKVFTFQITFALGATSVFLTFLIYGIATRIQDAKYSFEWGQTAISSQSFLIHSSTIFGIIYCCNGVMTEVDEVAILLHKVKPKRKEYHEAINTFSLQLMHQKVQFTACGLFNLDYTFIYLLMSTITTYMVILVQFGQAVSSQSNATKIE